MWFCFLNPGQCCPSCPEYQFNKQLEFKNCPNEQVELSLGSDKPYVEYNPQLDWTDHTRIQREVSPAEPTTHTH